MSRAMKLLALCLMAACATDPASQKCTLKQVGELPVTIDRNRPLVAGTINGQPARFLVDSGAFFSILTPQRTESDGLRVRPLPSGFVVQGVGGSERMKLAKVDELTLTGLLDGRVLSNADFLVGASIISELQLRERTDGLIGQNILGFADAEYDLANGVIRLFKAEGCAGPGLAYWAGDTPVGELKLRRRTPEQPLLIATARLNGQKIRVNLDSGAWRSTLTLRAAARAGITPDENGLASIGTVRGVGKRAAETFLGTFDVLELGGEVIRNARLLIADIKIQDTSDMLLGADFFLSHRIYIDSRANKVYFTYNGGPVFDVTSDATYAAGDESPAADEEAPNGDAQVGSAEPDSIRERMLRARARLESGDDEGAIEEFAAAQRAAPDDPDLPIEAARALGSAGKTEPAIALLDAWLEKYPDDRRFPDVLSGRCRLRAFADVELDTALADCNAAVEKGARSAIAFTTRAIVHLRLGSYAEAIADFTTALDVQPNDAAARYGRGLAALRAGNVGQGERDLDAARTIEPRIVETYARIGLTP